MKKKDNGDNNNIDIYENDWQTSVIQCRSALFHATERPKKKQKKYLCYKKNDFSITSDIYLDQGHKDILDILFAYGKRKVYDVNDGTKIIAISILVSEIRKMKKTNNIEWIMNKINDLRKVIITVTDKDRDIEATFNIINTYFLADKKKSTAQCVVELDRRYVGFFYEGDVPIDYHHLLNDIINIASYEIKAVVRYCLSQSKFVNEDLFEILSKVGYDVTIVSLRQQQKTKKIFKTNTEILKRFNIEYDYKTNTIKYIKTKQTQIYHLAKKENSPFVKTLPIVAALLSEQPKMLIKPVDAEKQEI